MLKIMNWREVYNMKVKRGEVWLIDLGIGVGSEQDGIRPCLIVQNNVGNLHSTTTVVCPITSKKKNFNATHVDVLLKFQSSIMCEQIRVVDTSRATRCIGSVNEGIMYDVEERLRLTLGI